MRIERRKLLDVAIMALLAGIYFLAGRLGLSLAVMHRSVSAVWPPTGIALAFLMLFGERFWPGILLGAFSINLATSGRVPSSVGIAIGNTLEAVVGAMLARRFASGTSAFDRAASLARYIFFAAIPCTAISASIGVINLFLERTADLNQIGPLWLTWWLGDLVSSFVLTPLLVLWVAKPLPRLRLMEVLEALGLLILLLLVGELVFGNFPPAYSLETLMLPLLLWSVFRFGQRGAMSAVCVISGITVWGTHNGWGPFIELNPNDSLVHLQAFIGIISLTALSLAAVLSERRLGQALLEDSERRFRQLAENIHEVFYISDLAQARMTYISPAYEELWGRSCQSLYENPMSFLDAIHPEDRTDVAEAVLRQSQGEPTETEYRVIRPDGSIRWVRDRAFPIRDGAGKVYRAIGIAEDIDDWKRSEEQRNRLLAGEQAARREAESANRAKDEFLAVLGHELRTPLTPVMLTASLLEQSPDLPDEARQDARSIRENAELEAHLIDDLLDLTRVRRGKLQMRWQSVDLYQTVRDAITICHVDDALNLKVELPDEPRFVPGDPVRLKQVFWNLLTNAFKFTPAGGSITIRPGDAPPGQIAIEVIDTGVGIEPGMLSKIFTPFEQGERAQARMFGGLGLGLAISKSLVTAHGGSITGFSPGKDKGSTFVVCLPLAAEPASPAQAGSAPALPGKAKRLKILVVEDHEMTRQVIAKLLIMEGHQVVAVGDIRSALAASESDIDLVISDLSLPDGSGLDLMRELRQIRPFVGIALSGYGMEDDLRHSSEAGFAEHLVKPVDLQKLCDAIDRVTADHPAAPVA